MATYNGGNRMDYWVYAVVFAAAFGAAAGIGAFVVPLLRKLKLGQHILEIGPNWHKSKEGTPVMGGIIFIIASVIVTLVVLAATGFRDAARVLCVLFIALANGAIGFLDDSKKLLKKQNLGLTAKQKLALQFVVGIVFIILVDRLGVYNGEVAIPFTSVVLTPKWFIVYPIALFMIVGTVNAANLTDGVDGLVTGVTLPMALFFGLAGHVLEFGSVAVFALALAGGLCGFLIYNFNPAKVFMGDTGSLFLGGATIGLAFVIGKPLVFILVGLIYYIEALSVMLQVSWFKVSRGKRIFKMAPIHHHFELCGWSEKTLFTVFTLFTTVLCALSALWVMGIL